MRAEKQTERETREGVSRRPHADDGRLRRCRDDCLGPEVSIATGAGKERLLPVFSSALKESNRGHGGVRSSKSLGFSGFVNRAAENSMPV